MTQLEGELKKNGNEDAASLDEAMTVEEYVHDTRLGERTRSIESQMLEVNQHWWKEQRVND